MLFHSNADPSMYTQEDVVIFTNASLSDCVFKWIPFGSQACSLKLKVNDRSLCILQVDSPNAVNKDQIFMDDVNNALQRVSSRESTAVVGDFNAQIETNNATWKGLINGYGDLEFKESWRYLLQLCFINKICIIRTFFQQRDILSTYSTDLVWRRSL